MTRNIVLCFLLLFPILAVGGEVKIGPVAAAGQLVRLPDVYRQNGVRVTLNGCARWVFADNELTAFRRKLGLDLLVSIPADCNFRTAIGGHAETNNLARPLQAPVIPADPLYWEQGYLHSIGWSIDETNYAGESLVVVIGTGVNSQHRDLNLNFSERSKSFAQDFPKDQDEVTVTNFEHGHESMVAGIVAARMNGVGVVGINPNAKIVSFKVFRPVNTKDENGLFKVVWWSDLETIIRAFTELAELPGTLIVNCSFEIGGESEILTEIVRALRDKVLFVVAAGNSGDGRLNIPANIQSENLVVVTAVMRTEDGREVLPKFANFGEKVRLAAPGYNNLSTSGYGNDYAFASGTSFAAPVVAGVGSRVRNRFPNLSPVKVLRAITDGAKFNPDLIEKIPQFPGQPYLPGAIAAAGREYADDEPIKITHVVNLAGNAMAVPGDFLQIFGEGFSKRITVPESPSMQTDLVQVYLNECSLPITYVSPTQVNVQVPSDQCLGEGFRNLVVMRYRSPEYMATWVHGYLSDVRWEKYDPQIVQSVKNEDGSYSFTLVGLGQTDDSKVKEKVTCYYDLNPQEDCVAERTSPGLYKVRIGANKEKSWISAQIQVGNKTMSVRLPE